MSTDFNHERAWHELAKPAFDALPPAVHTLLGNTTELAKALHQERRTLLMPWPEGLQEQFEALDDDTLAQAARVVYFYGHWRPGDTELLRVGETWKFAHYCDQVLRARVRAAGLSCERDSSEQELPGYSYKIVEGLVRLCYLGAGRNGSWFWVEVAPGTVEMVRKLHTERIAADFHSTEQAAYVAMHGAPMKKLKALLVPPGHWAAPWVADRKFVDHQPGTSYDDDEAVDLLADTCPADFEVMDRRAVNFRVVDGSGAEIPDVPGHPFMIGMKHFPGEHDGLNIDVNKAPCAMQGCNRPHNRHAHDVVLVVKALRTMPNREAVAALKKIVDRITAHNAANPNDQLRVDGFVRVESEHEILPPEPGEIKERKSR